MKGNNHLRELDRGGGKLVGHGKDDPFSVSVTTSNKGGSFGLATGNDSQLLSATVTSTTTSRAHGGTFSLPKGDISDEHVGLPGEHMKLVSDDGLSDEKGEDTDDSDDASEYVPESVEHEQDGSYAAHAAECEESDANETKTDGALNQQYKGDKGYENALDFEGHELSEAMNGEMYGLMEGELPVLPADHPSQPRALNKMNKHRKNDPRGGPQIPDPNGRFEGRSLIMWHRPRMLDKLVLHIQYECHLAKINLPWDKIAHRLSPGSSGPAVIQYLNKSRDVLIAEGHMVPPNMGKSSALYDPNIRGYVRDFDQEIPTQVRNLHWGDTWVDLKESLTDHGMIFGSGKYDRNPKNRPVIHKDKGRRSRVPPETKNHMDEIRAKKGARGGRKSAAKNEQLVIKDEDGQVHPANFDNNDDEYETQGAASKRKVKSTSTSRKKSRGGDAECKVKQTVVSGLPKNATLGSTRNSAAKNKSDVSLDTVSKRSRGEDMFVPAPNDLQIGFRHGEVKQGNQEYTQVQFFNDNTAGMQSYQTPQFGAHPLDIHNQVQAGLTPPYNAYYGFQPQSSSHYQNVDLFDNFIPTTENTNVFGSTLAETYPSNPARGVASRNIFDQNSVGGSLNVQGGYTSRARSQAGYGTMGDAAAEIARLRPQMSNNSYIPPSGQVLYHSPSANQYGLSSLPLNSSWTDSTTSFSQPATFTNQQGLNDSYGLTYTDFDYRQSFPSIFEDEDDESNN